MPIFFVEGLSSCGEQDEGCSFGGEESRIEIRSDTPVNHLELLIMHEIGHLLRGDGLHLAAPSALMSSPTHASGITQMDLEFVCEKQGAACASAAPAT